MTNTYRVTLRHSGNVKTALKVDAAGASEAINVARQGDNGASVVDVTVRCEGMTKNGHRCSRFSHDARCASHAEA